jgi:hypothetical protein
MTEGNYSHVGHRGPVYKGLGTMNPCDYDYMSTTFVHLHGVERNSFTFTLYGMYNKLTKLYTVKYTSLNYFYVILLMTKIQFVLLNCKCVNHQAVN